MKRKIMLMLLAVLMFVPASVTASGGLKTIEVYPNLVNIRVNENFITADNFMYNNTTYVPLRAVSEMLGAVVQWDGATMTANISLPVTSRKSEDDSFALPLHLYSYDRKTYLGKLVTDDMDPDGLWYRLIGDYSNKVSPVSIWNVVGKYGSSVSMQSAFCKLADEPPIIVDNEGTFVMYLTVNPTMSPSCDPDMLKALLTNLGQ